MSRYTDEVTELIEVKKQKVFEDEYGNRLHSVRIVVGRTAFRISTAEITGCDKFGVDIQELDTTISIHRHTGQVNIFTDDNEKVTKKTRIGRFNDETFKCVQLEVVN
tara:strand:+ start:863 stop:1183 length:321 start_codon:yes stop_codon:yes gene_type:complete